MKSTSLFLAAAIALALQFNAASQTNAPAEAAAPAHVNVALIPVPRTGSITNRQSQVLQRAKDAPGDYDIEFIGDSITQGWEGAGKNVWSEINAKYKVINFGVSGDRTEHVLWRFGQGQLDGIKAKAAVVMIGTNNSNKNKDGTWTYTDSDILEGVTAIVNEIRRRQPDTKVLLLGIFPRGKAFNEQRGRLLEINQALARLDDGKNIFFLDFGSQFIENDGTIATDMMKDALHPGEKGYRIWANAMQPKLTEIVGK
jgi:beta-glucosidase